MCVCVCVYISSQHLKWIKQVHQSCVITRTHFCFRTTLMKGSDPLQMLTSVYVYVYVYIYIYIYVHKRPISLKFCSQICLNLC